MSQALADIALQLNTPHTNGKGETKPVPKVQLIYAFNGSGKTRLSREFKDLIAPKNDDGEGNEASRDKILYYNAFTEDLFYWDNDLETDTTPKLKIQPNSFTDWVLKDQGKGPDIVSNFQHYATNKITPVFNAGYQTTGEDGKKIDVPENSEVTFRLNPTNIVTEDGEPILTEDGDTIVTEQFDIVKISKGEESNFIWSVFAALIDQVVSVLNEHEDDDPALEQFKDLEYIFIDDPVSSLDENHLIELAVDVAKLIKTANFVDGKGLRFIVTTHNPLFYNVLFNELNRDDKRFNYKAKHFAKHRLTKKNDGTFLLEEQNNDSPFSYHLFLLAELERAIENDEIRKYHFSFLRNILEKTSTFLGYSRWEDLLPRTADGKYDPYANRILNLSSHSKHSGEEVAEITEDDKRVLGFLVSNIRTNNQKWQKEGAAQ